MVPANLLTMMMRRAQRAMSVAGTVLRSLASSSVGFSCTRWARFFTVSRVCRGCLARHSYAVVLVLLAVFYFFKDGSLVRNSVSRFVPHRCFGMPLPMFDKERDE